MEGLTHRAPLRLGLRDPFAGSGAVDLGGSPASPSRYPVQDRPVERGVDDVLVGHVRPLFLNTPNLKPGALGDYGAKSRIVQ